MTVRTGPSPSSGKLSGESVPIRNDPPGSEIIGTSSSWAACVALGVGGTELDSGV